MKEQGQVMLITVLALSGTILGATAIAGLLMLYQIRQSADAANSAKAVFAADAGVEHQLFKLYKDPNFCVSNNPEATAEELSNGSSYSGTCFLEGKVATIRSIGTAGNNISRAFEVVLEK